MGRFVFAVLALFLSLPAAYSRAEAPSGNDPARESAPPYAGLEVDAGYTRESLNNGYKDWQDTHAQLLQKLDGGIILYGGVRQTERFSLIDNEVSGGIHLPTAGDMYFNAEASFSPTYEVLPHWSGFAEAGTVVLQWGFSAGYKRMEYTLSRVDMGVFRVERYAGNFRGAYTFYPVNVDNAGSALSHAFRLDWFYGDKSFAGIGYATGREVEYADGAGLLVSSVEEYYLTARQWIGNHLALGLEAGTHRQIPYYTRNWVSIGIRRAF